MTCVVHHASSSSSSSTVVSDGPRHRTLLPLSASRGLLALEGFDAQVDAWLARLVSNDVLGVLMGDMRTPAVQLVTGAAQDVAAELKLVDGSEACDALLQAAMHAGKAALSQQQHCMIASSVGSSNITSVLMPWSSRLIGMHM